MILAQMVPEPPVEWFLTGIGPYIGLFVFMAMLLWRCYTKCRKWDDD